MGNHHTDNISASTLYRKASATRIHLCYSHSIEYFKIGQFSFFKKYQETLFSAYSNTDKSVFDFLREEILTRKTDQAS
jgi:hypothetical protein